MNSLITQQYIKKNSAASASAPAPAPRLSRVNYLREHVGRTVTHAHSNRLFGAIFLDTDVPCVCEISSCPKAEGSLY